MNPTDKKAESPMKAKMQGALSGLGKSQTPAQGHVTPQSGSHVSPVASGTGKATGSPNGHEHHIRVHKLDGEGSSTGFVVTHHTSKDDHEPVSVHAIEDVRGLKKHIAEHYGEDSDNTYAQTGDKDQAPAPKDKEKASPMDRKETKGSVSE
jgi:hypothetical protein